MSVKHHLVFFVCLELFSEAGTFAGEKSRKYFDVETRCDLSYRDDAKSDPVKHKLDLFLPKGEKNFPVVMYVHGGRWQSGDKEYYQTIGTLFARNGIGTAIVNYRLTTGEKPARHPDHIEDVARAFAWLHTNIEEYGGRKDCLFVCGHSAGGHLVSLLAADEKYLEAENRSPKDIRGVIPISGVFNVNPIHDLFHPVFGDDRELCRQASPIVHVKKNLPPFLILYADQDFPTLDRMAQDMDRKLTAKKVDSQLVKVESRTHLTIYFWMALSEKDPCTKAVMEFVKRHSK